VKRAGVKQHEKQQQDNTENRERDGKLRSCDEGPHPPVPDHSASFGSGLTNGHLPLLNDTQVPSES
jgi:hypothetical protein